MEDLLSGVILRVVITTFIVVLFKTDKHLTAPWWFGILAIFYYWPYMNEPEQATLPMVVGLFLPEHAKLVILIKGKLTKKQKEEG